ncbi:MAG TPA: NAD+ synthase [Dehalococcoidia bacterium]|nr:NAD+ synthase [Dehalococcoidia bacterium]|tara:strand:+ start:2525 stop:4270 length:1746 start_codon:yes stop_codon:yes gene_type:complete
MTRIFRLSMAQMNPTVGDIKGNTAKIIQYLEQARELEADMVAFPELAITGYPPEDLLFKTSFLKDNVAAMEHVVAASKGIAVVVGYVKMGTDISNAAALGYDGKLIDVYEKMYLPNYGVFDEDRYFRSGTVCPVYVVNGVSVGLGICEDIWAPVGPITVQKKAGAELIVNINASPFHAGKGAERAELISTRAADNGLIVAYLNCIGGQDELVFDGDSMVSDAGRKMVARGPAFEESLMTVDLDIDELLRSRSGEPSPVVETPTNLQEIGESKTVHVSDYLPQDRKPLEHVRSDGSLDPVEEVYRALVMGTRDYLVKTGFSKALIGLSGGIDSALTTTVAVDALGPENVVGVAMPSRFSSEGSISDSQELADNLGMELWEVPIEPAHTAFADMLESHFQGTQPNVAEENVQARIRGNILMTISNKFGWMVLTTGNKSEMAMGYATLYGDMAGGFAVIKDVPKTLVYQLCEWRNQHGEPSSVIPQAVINKPPSAELREDQLDQDTLPAYEVLDPVIKAYVEDDYSYQDMVAMGFDSAVVSQVIAFVDRNEYKRRQAPPGVKITHRAFGKDRRLPIVNRYKQQE